jgi:hypothetical protein
MQLPLSPPLADLHTKRSDLALLEESDDLLSPSVLGAAAASKVRAALSPVKGNFRARNGVLCTRRQSLSTPASLHTLKEEDEAHDGAAADDSPPPPAVPSQLPEPKRCESPPDSSSAAATAAASTLERSPALAAMQASIAASHHVDAEVRTTSSSTAHLLPARSCSIAYRLGSPAPDVAL